MDEKIVIKKYAKLRERLKEIEAALQDEAVFKDIEKYKGLSREHSSIVTKLEVFRAYNALLTEYEGVKEMLAPGADAEMLEMAEKEKAEIDVKLKAKFSELVLNILPKDDYEGRDLFLEIRAGTGGDEASLFAAQLMKMYVKFAEKKGCKVDPVSSHATGLGGFKEVIVKIKGKEAWGSFKYEMGVHRVQRVPETEASGRVHTSTVTVAVLPEAEEVDIKISPEDLRIDTFCSSGAGGQSVNTTYSAVRITHIPTGTVVSCQDERSQMKNRDKAMSVLRSRLLAMKIEAEEKKLKDKRKQQVGTGDRSEKIRTYNFPQSRITDHRIGKSVFNVGEFMAGDMGEMVNSLKLFEFESSLEAE